VKATTNQKVLMGSKEVDEKHAVNQIALTRQDLILPFVPMHVVLPAWKTTFYKLSVIQAICIRRHCTIS
jgi:hypothetical protein